MNFIIVYPDETERPLDGPIPRKGEMIKLDSYAQFKDGVFCVRHTGYISNAGKLFARVYLEYS